MEYRPSVMLRAIRNWSKSKYQVLKCPPRLILTHSIPRIRN